MRHPVRLARLLALALVLAAAALARAEIQFIGLLVMRDTTRFALLDTSTGQTDWIDAKGRFAGYRVSAFDPKNDTLTLTRDGTDLSLRLVDDAKVKKARFELTGTITLGAAEKLEVVRATLLYDQENIFPLRDGTIYKIKPTRRPDHTINYSIQIERAVGNRIDRLSAPSVTTRPGQSFKLQLDDYGFEFTPR